jgi:hypothetical protein
VFSTGFQSVFMGVVAALLLGSLVRWRRTPTSHPDFGVRGDMTRLLLAFLIGQGIMLVRSQFLPKASGEWPNATGFWICSAALLPVVIAVLTLVLRLFNAYRHPDDGTLPAKKQ